jgi:hypothetical protein
MKDNNTLLTPTDLLLLHRSLLLIHFFIFHENKEFRKLIIKEDFLRIIYEILIYHKNKFFIKKNDGLLSLRNNNPRLLPFIISSLQEILLCINTFYNDGKKITNFLFGIGASSGVYILISVLTYFVNKDSTDDSTLKLVELMCDLLKRSFEHNNITRDPDFKNKINILSTFIGSFKSQISPHSQKTKTLVQCLWFFCEVMRVEVKNTRTLIYSDSFIQTNNEYMLRLYRITKDINDGSIVENIQFLSCVIFGFMNKGKDIKSINRKYDEILIRLKKYVTENKGIWKDLATESCACVPFNS